MYNEINEEYSNRTGIKLLLSDCLYRRKEIPPVTGNQNIVDQNWQFETTPVWSDDFNGNGAPDPAKWSFETGGTGWGNNELQYYTDGGNATVNGGNLVITAKRESVSGRGIHICQDDHKRKRRLALWTF